MTRYVVAIEDTYYVDAESEEEAKEIVQENIGSDDYYVDSPRVVDTV